MTGRRATSGFLLAALLTLGCVTGSAADEWSALRGEYVAVAGTNGSDPLPDAELSGMRLSVRGNAMTFLGLEPRALRMEFLLDPLARPRRIDFVYASVQRGAGRDASTPGSIVPGIYELQGDILRLGWPKTGQIRPDGFMVGAGPESEGPQFFFVVFRKLAGTER